MKIRITFCFMLLCFLIAPNVFHSGTAIAAPPSTGYELSYEENFAGTSLNTADWFYRTGQRLGGYNLENNVRVGPDANGVSSLHIDFKYEDYNNDGIMDYTGGGVVSRHQFGYGYYEVRAKLYGASKGLHQSFWSMGTSYSPDVSSGTAPASNMVVEIDGFETDSSTPGKVGTNGHLYVPAHSAIGGVNYDIDTTDWFTMGYEWLPGKVKFYVNGSLVRVMRFDQFYAPQNVWLTGLPTPDAYGGAVPPLPGAEMLVDYFRYYSKTNYGNLLGNAGFEYNGSTQPNAPMTWIETGSTAASFVDTVDHRSGTASLRHDSGAAYQVTTKQSLEFIPNSTYRLSAWVKGSGGQSEASMKVMGYGGTELSIPIPAASSWTKMTIDNIEVTNNKATVAFASYAPAGAWIQVDDVVFEDAAAVPPSGEPIVIDNGDPEYTESGAWLNSGLTGLYGTTTRYAGTAVGPYARWTPNIPSAGSYDVYVYKIANASSDPNAKLDIVYDGGTDTKYIDYSTGVSGWAWLGTYPFAAGTGGYVQNSLHTSGKYARADAVQFVPH